MATYRGACNVCYTGKVKCVRGPDGGACLRCQNAGRECVYGVAGKVGRPRRPGAKPRSPRKTSPGTEATSDSTRASPMSRSETTLSACSSVFSIDRTCKAEPGAPTPPIHESVFSWDQDHHAPQVSPASYSLDWGSMGFAAQDMDADNNGVLLPTEHYASLASAHNGTCPDAKPVEATISNPSLTLAMFPPSPPPTVDMACADPATSLNRLASMQFEMSKLRHERAVSPAMAQPVFSTMAEICCFTRGLRRRSASSGADVPLGVPHDPQFSMLLLTLAAVTETLEHFVQLVHDALGTNLPLALDCGPFASGDDHLDASLALSVLGFHLRQLGRDLSSLRESATPGGYTLTMLDNVVDRMQMLHGRIDDCRSMVR